jgi:hypothetical protein
MTLSPAPKLAHRRKQMHNKKVKELIDKDMWSIAHGNRDAGPFILRYREPVLQPEDISGYHRCLRIVWGYADADLAELPKEKDSAVMETFENRLCEILERDALAALVAVLTFDGARQWIFYTYHVSR